MNDSTWAMLNETEKELLRETESDALVGISEDALSSCTRGSAGAHEVLEALPASGPSPGPLRRLPGRAHAAHARTAVKAKPSRAAGPRLSAPGPGGQRPAPPRSRPSASPRPGREGRTGPAHRIGPSHRNGHRQGEARDHRQGEAAHPGEHGRPARLRDDPPGPDPAATAGEHRHTRTEPGPRLRQLWPLPLKDPPRPATTPSRSWCSRLGPSTRW